MASAIFLLVLSFSAFSSVTKAQWGSSNISLASSLSPTTKNNSWVSSSGQFGFGFYPKRDGFAIGIWFVGSHENTIIWTANRDDPPISSNVTLLLTRDGGLVLRTFQDKSITELYQPASSASMQDSGNFVIYNSDLEIIWQSFSLPTDTILPGQPLLPRKLLYSSVSPSDHSTGRFQLLMVSDGNLVLYPFQMPHTGANPYWSSDTWGNTNVSLNLDNNGRLYLKDGTGLNIKTLTNGGFPSNNSIFYRMTIDVDGILRVYGNSSNWSIIWAPPSLDGCSPIGICGINSYCTLMDQDFNCICLSGFDFIDPSQKTLGCKRNFSKEICQNGKENNNYTMDSIESIVWADVLNFSSLPTYEDDCKNSCLDDCTCDVALFMDEKCLKRNLPLKYGRVKNGNTTKTWVKVNTGNVQSNEEDLSPQKEGNHEKGKKEIRLDILITSVVLFICSFVFLLVSIILIYRYRVFRYEMMKTEQDNSGLEEEICLRSFTYAELEKATNNFQNELGRGSFGIVYKGALSNGKRLVAVKRLDKVEDKGVREFNTEMKVIGRTHHKNLVRLLGYCHDQSNRLLVYEYMSNGSLANLIFNPEKRPCWGERVGIALNIARGILYLHEECETQIMHCDIKPQNILIDENRCAKISDFGIAKLLKQDETTTMTRGTRGYFAPEWLRKMRITVKVDVFSFGIVLLEIICCRRSVEMNFAEDEVILSDWVFDRFEMGELHMLVGDEEVDRRMLQRMAWVALWCIQEEPLLRPSIKKVVLMLEGIIDVPIPPRSSSFLSSV